MHRYAEKHKIGGVKNTAKIIQRLRAFGLTQTEISRRTGIPQPRLSKWGNGAVPNHVDDALRLAELLRKLEATEGAEQ